MDHAEYKSIPEDSTDSDARRSTCLASSSRSTFPDAKKGESGGNLRRRGVQYGKPNSPTVSTAMPIAIAFKF